jgi:hypothetical protein
MRKLTLLLATLLAFVPKPSDAAVFTLATEQINLDGYNLRCDSFSSSDTNRSTDGHYDPAKAGDGSYVGVAQGIFDPGHGGSVSIWSYLDTEPASTLEIGASGSIGGTAWHLAGTPGIEPGHHTTNYPNIWPDVVAPFASLAPTGGTVDGATYTYVLSTGDYELNDLMLSGNEKVLVNGAARLIVRGDVKLSGNASIRIEPAGRLQLFVGGASANIGGGGINNLGGPKGFIYYGLPGNTALTFKINKVTALIYAPMADCTITSPGHAVAELEGAMVVKSLSLAADLNVHVDESL